MTRPRPRTPDDPYVQAARFVGEQPAGRAYFALQQAIFTAAPNDLSVYRILLDGVSHVVVVGVRPPPTLEERLTAILAAGTPTELPAMVRQTLLARRAQVTPHQSWWDGQVRPVPPKEPDSLARDGGSRR